MKRLLSLILSVCVVVTALSFTGVNAYAAESKFNEQKQQFNSQNSSFNFDGDKYVRIKYAEKAEIYFASSFGKKEKLVTKEGSAAYPTVKGSYVYWINYAKGAIMRCKTNGSGKKAVVKFDAENDGLLYIISGKKLIYQLTSYDAKTYKVKSSKLYTAALTGKNKKSIATGISGYGMYTYKNKVYFIKSNKLYSYSFKTKKTALVKKGFKGMQINGMEGADLYYLHLDSEGDTEAYTVRKINVKTKKVKKIGVVKSEKSIWSMITTGSGVFVITDDNDLGKKSFAKFRNGKLDYETYEKKYDIAGDNMSFYKNFIVFDENKLNSDGFPEGAGYIKVVKVK